MKRLKRLLIAHILMFFSALFYPGVSHAEISDSLRTAIVVADIESVKRFIAEGADVNKIYDDKSTPLLEATEKSYGSSDIVVLLLQYGANPTLKPAGFSPLSVALRTNNEEIIRLLRPYAEDEGDFYGLALFHWNRNEDSAAMEYADKALKLNPLNDDAWAIKGSIYCSQKNMKGAENAYHNALEASLEHLKTNKSADGLATAIWHAVLAADFPEAQRLGKEALSLFPESGLIAMNMGHAQLFLGEKKEAMALYKKAYRILKQSDQYGDQAAQLFTDDFSYLKARYPDKQSLIGWADRKALEPFDFPYSEIPFGEGKDVALNLVEGADIKKEGPPVIGMLDPILKKQFGEGIYPLELTSQLNPAVVEKYSVACDKWDALERIDLFFIASPGQGDKRTLFLVSKVFKAQQGGPDVLFSAGETDISKELNMQPSLPAPHEPSHSGSAIARIAVWKLKDTTVMLDVASVSPSAAQSRIIYVSKKGWGTYLNSLPVKKTQ